jgi:hypothetical protein
VTVLCKAAFARTHKCTCVCRLRSHLEALPPEPELLAALRSSNTGDAERYCEYSVVLSSTATVLCAGARPEVRICIRGRLAPGGAVVSQDRSTAADRHTGEALTKVALLLVVLCKGGWRSMSLRILTR